MTNHWAVNDDDRAAHPAPCPTNPDGTRQHTPMPNPADMIRNFGRAEDQQ